MDENILQTSPLKSTLAYWKTCKESKAPFMNSSLSIFFHIISFGFPEKALLCMALISPDPQFFLNC